MDLKGKVTLVTGGGRGIGRAISLSLGKEGAKVVVNYFRHPQNAEEVVKIIESQGGGAMAIKADVTLPSEVDSMINKIIKKFNRIDVLVNNAGHLEEKPLPFFQSTTEEVWDRTIAIHLKAPFLCCKRIVPYMIKQKMGKIINIGSTAGFLGGWGVAYATAKGGLNIFTKSLARYLAKYNIMVNCVAPGPTVTDLPGGYHSEPHTEEEYNQRREEAKKSGNYPLGRIGEPEDIASAVLFLISNDYITGETIYVCGGMHTLYHP